MNVQQFNASEIRERIVRIKIAQSFGLVSEFIKGKGYSHLFFTRATDNKLSILQDVFGIPRTPDIRVAVCGPEGDRWFYYQHTDLGFWTAFKTDQDAIYFKMMSIGKPESWELP